jgi:hypothetical protein
VLQDPYGVGFAVLEEVAQSGEEFDGEGVIFDAD